MAIILSALRFLMKIEKEIIKILEERDLSPEELSKAKRDLSKKHRLPMPTNVSVLRYYHKKGGKDEGVINTLKTRPVRSLSGVVNISVLTKPFPCPGECVFCPLQKDAPKSYLKNEPAVMRAILTEYSAKRQMKARINSLRETGHPTNKIELRIVGGTWSYYPKEYQEKFIKDCFDACNKKKSSSLKEAQKKNETADHRIVCLSIETRPDFINKEEIIRLRNMGVTMVELGVQSLFDDVLQKCKRGHTQKETKKATRLLKDAGFKVCHQVMLNLPGSSLKKDYLTFKRLFSNPAYRPDFLKIYPCLVIKEAPLYKIYKKGEYTPLSDKDLLRVLKKIKREVIPPYVRIQRLFRDIPSNSIAGGSKISNIREMLQKENCACIRCNEVKNELITSTRKEKIVYTASRGEEVFLTIKTKEKICALLRLRFSERCIIKDAGMIRELHTYGQQLYLKKKSEDAAQHRGMGKELVKMAEEEAKKRGKKRIAVISGVGAREYWRSLGYRRKRSYMIKDL